MNSLESALITESHINRARSENPTLTKKQRDAIKELKTNEDIVIRKADKSNTYVLMDKQDYVDKITELISDPTKFKKVPRDPTEQIKKAINREISVINAEKNDLQFKKIEGNFKPGYAYGNCKTHKSITDPPLRLIISQITSPTYPIAKKLDAIIKPYMPNKYTLSSTDEFINLINSPETYISLGNFEKNENKYK